MALFKHTLSGVSGTAPWSFTLHTTGNTDYITAQGYWHTALVAGWQGTNKLEDIYPTTVEGTLSSTVSISESTDKQISRDDTVETLPGTISGNVLPFQVAIVVSLKSIIANRTGMGRFYLPPADVSMVTAGKLSSTALTNLQTGLNALFSSLNANGLIPVIRNRTAHTSTTITTGRVGNVFDTQRRRRDSVTETYTGITIP